jgi:hypothetical protein
VIVAASFLVNMIADGVTFSFGVLFVEFQVTTLATRDQCFFIFSPKKFGDKNWLF